MKIEDYSTLKIAADNMREAKDNFKATIQTIIGAGIGKIELLVINEMMSALTEQPEFVLALTKAWIEEVFEGEE